MNGAALGIAAGAAADAAFADPTRLHPVAGFGILAGRLEQLLYRDARGSGVVYAGIAVAAPVLAVITLERRAGRMGRVALLAATTWAAIGTTSLAREGDRMAALLADNDLPAARQHLSHLCARDAADLDAAELARATIESLAENTSDAGVAPLLWAAILGAPGAAGYRAINTLDAMVGYRSPRYARFGWTAAKLDDLVNLVPARLTAALTALSAPAVDGFAAAAWQTWRRDGTHHPSPNAGHCEAAFAGALGVSLGGTNVYGGRTEVRGRLGSGRTPDVADIRRAASLARWVSLAATVLAALLAAAAGGRRRSAARPAQS